MKFHLRVVFIMESLILAQDERWRRVLSMQVERDYRCLHLYESGERVSNTWVICPSVGDKCRDAWEYRIRSFGLSLKRKGAFVPLMDEPAHY